MAALRAQGQHRRQHGDFQNVRREDLQGGTSGNGTMVEL